MTLCIDIAGVPADGVCFAASPLAELTAMLHVLAAPDHHPRAAAWAAGVRAALRPELAERLHEAEFLWRSSRADFLVPAAPRATLAEELDDVDRIADDAYVTSALITTCGSNRLFFGGPSPLVDPAARERALDRAQARGALQEAFAERLLADPAAVRARVRETLEWCAGAFFAAAWPAIDAQLAADLRRKADLRAHHGLGRTLASVSPSVTLDRGERILVDLLQDNIANARDTGVTLIPSMFGHPHLVVVCRAGRRPTLQYPVAEPGVAEPVPLDAVQRRLDALAHPVRLRLVRTLARGPHTTGELADAWGLTAPEVSRHLAVLRRAGLLTAHRRGRYVHYALDLTAATTLGADLVAAVLR